MVENYEVMFVCSTLKRVGPSNQTLNIIKGSPIKDKCIVVTLFKEPVDSIIEEYDKLNIKVICLNLNKISYIFKGKKRLKRLIKQLNVKIVHSYGINPDYICQGATKNTTVQHVITLRNFPKEDIFTRMNRISARIAYNIHIKTLLKADNIVACSKTIEEKMKREYPKINIMSIQNGVDTDKYLRVTKREKSILRQKYNYSKDSLIFISTSSFIPRKRIEETISSYLKIQDTIESILLLLGDGIEYEELHEKYSANKNIKFIGKTDKVIEYLQLSDVFISSSESEGLPNGVIEAISCGLPVILSDIPQHKEILNDMPEVGVLYELGSVGDLANNMLDNKRILNLNEKEYIKKSSLTMQNMSKSYFEIYKKILIGDLCALEKNIQIKEKIYKNLIVGIGIFTQITPILPRSAIVLFFAACFLAFLVLNKNTLKVTINKQVKWYGMFFLYVIFSIVYTINTINYDFVILRMSYCIGTILLLSQFIKKTKDYKYLLNGLIIGGFVGIIIVLINQYDLIGVRRLGSGIYGSAVEFGFVVTITLYCLIWKAYNNNKKKKLFFYILTMLTFFVALATGTRKALFFPIIFFIVLQIIDYRKTIKNKIYFIVIISVISLISLNVILTNDFFYELIGKRVESAINSIVLESDEDKSLEERNVMKKVAFTMFTQKPIFGYGVHGFAYIFYIDHGKLLYSHDTFLELLSCFGIIGFLLYYSVYYFIGKNFILLYKAKTKVHIIIFFLAFIVVTLVAEPYSMSYLTSQTVVLIGSALQCSCKAIEESKNEENEENG